MHSEKVCKEPGQYCEIAIKRKPLYYIMMLLSTLKWTAKVLTTSASSFLFGLAFYLGIVSLHMHMIQINQSPVEVFTTCKSRWIELGGQDPKYFMLADRMISQNFICLFWISYILIYICQNALFDPIINFLRQTPSRSQKFANALVPFLWFKLECLGCKVQLVLGPSNLFRVAISASCRAYVVPLQCINTYKTQSFLSISSLLQTLCKNLMHLHILG